MAEKREQLGSRLGFILLSAGCAIGCGNVWKFPWMTGQYGGGAFVLVYLICLVILGLPAMTMEFSLGRASQKSPVRMYQELEKPGQKWHIHGYFALFGNIALMSFYLVVTGWMVYYFWMFLTGQSSGLSFGGMIANPKINVLFLAITVIIAFSVLCFELSKGLEKVTKYMMIVLFMLMIGLCINSATLPGAKSGLSFYLLPELKKINISVIVAAMNQAFFTLSLGIGSMAIFGSYVDKKRSLLGESLNVIVLDTLVAIMAGLIIFPACSTYDISVGAGPSLLFDTMATVFNQMKGGQFWGTLFFLFMVFAAFSTVLAVCENILACVRELTGFSRPKGCLLCAVVLFVMALTTAFGYNILGNVHPLGGETAFLDLWDFIVSNNLLPLGAMLITVFCCSKKFGWGWDNFTKEANAGEGLKVRNWMKPIFMFVVPIVIIIVYVVGIIDFFG